jgi:hypothetical protein
MLLACRIGANADQEQPTTAAGIEQRMATALGAQDGVHALEAANAGVAWLLGQKAILAAARDRLDRRLAECRNILERLRISTALFVDTAQPKSAIVLDAARGRKVAVGDKVFLQLRHSFVFFFSRLSSIY